MAIKKSLLRKAKVQRSETANNAGPLTATAKKKRDGGKQPKHHARKDRVTVMMRRAKILKAAVEGKSLTQAAIATGLSPKSAARQATQILQNAITQGAFAMLLGERGLTDKFLADKIKALLDAKQTLYFQKDGIVTDQREVEALETQRKTAELVAKLKGLLREQPQVNINGGLMAIVVQAMRSPGGELYEGEPQDVAETRREVPRQGGYEGQRRPSP